MGIDGCDPRGRCVNTAGSFQCMCDSLTGFQLGSDQRTCVGMYTHAVLYTHIPLKVPLYLSPPSLCSTFSTLFPASLSAPPSLLLPHLRFSSVDTQTSQSDVNECAQDLDNCQQLCSNTVGSFTCSCEIGYELDVDGFTCALNGTIGEA